MSWRSRSRRVGGMALSTVLVLVGLVLFIALGVTLATTYSLNLSKREHGQTQVESLARSALSEFILRSESLKRSSPEDPLEPSNSLSYHRNFKNVVLYRDPNQSQNYCEVTFDRNSGKPYSTDNSLSNTYARGYYDGYGESSIPPFSIELVLNCHVGSLHKEVRVILNQIWPYAVTAKRSAFISGIPGESSPSTVKGDVLVMPFTSAEEDMVTTLEGDSAVASLSPDTILGFAGNSNFSLFCEYYCAPLVIGAPQIQVAAQSLAPFPDSLLAGRVAGDPKVYYRTITDDYEREPKIHDFFHTNHDKEHYEENGAPPILINTIIGGWQIGDGNPKAYVKRFLEEHAGGDQNIMGLSLNKHHRNRVLATVAPSPTISGTGNLLRQAGSRGSYSGYYHTDQGNIVEGDLYVYKDHVKDQTHSNSKRNNLDFDGKYVVKGGEESNEFSGRVIFLEDHELDSYENLFQSLTQKLSQSASQGYIDLKMSGSQIRKGPRKGQTTGLLSGDFTLSQDRNTLDSGAGVGSHYRIFGENASRGLAMGMLDSEESSSLGSTAHVLSNIRYHLPVEDDRALKNRGDYYSRLKYALQRDFLDRLLKQEGDTSQPLSNFNFFARDRFPHFRSKKGYTLTKESFKGSKVRGYDKDIRKPRDKHGLKFDDYEGTVLEFFPSTLTLQDATLAIYGSLILASPPDDPERIPLKGHQATIICGEDLYIKGGEIDSGDQGLVLMGRNVFIESGGDFKGLIIALENLSILPDKDKPLKVTGGIIAGSRVLLRNTEVKYDPNYMRGINTYGQLKVLSWEMMP